MSPAAVLFLLFVFLLRKLWRKETDFLATVRLRIRFGQKLCYDNVLSLCLGVKICPLRVCECVRACVRVNLSPRQGGLGRNFYWGKDLPLKQEDFKMKKGSY